jgi:hypothetical protein
MEADRKNSVRMLVRRHIMEILHKNPGTEFKLPSNDALAKKLSVARSTAQLELKLLLNEGFLSSKAGIGTFTNPAKGPLANNARPLIALLDGDGKTVYYGYSGWELKSRIGSEIAKLPATVEDVKIYSSRPKDVLAELLGMECAAFVWISPAKSLTATLEALARQRKVFVARASIEGASSLEWDDEAFGRKLAENLLRFGRKRPLFLDTFQDSPQRLGIVRAFAEAGLDFPRERYFNSPDARERIAKTLKDGFRPDSLIFRHEDGDFIIGKLRELGIDLKEECRLVSIMYKPRCLSEPMLLQPFDSKGFAERLAAMLARRLEDPSRPAERERDAFLSEMRLV